ncbi:hypothetical protein LTS10_013304 [Elasticomyces elasticus]|nr:hypothetical protein LTS10_013304 [Elasticomyces elasticus]
MSQPQLNPFLWYRLTTDNLPGVCLDVVNDGTAHTEGKLQMSPTGVYTGQRWQVLPPPEGSFCMRTSYTGTDMLLCFQRLDAHLTCQTNVREASVRWQLEPVRGEGARFTSRFRIRAESANIQQGHYLTTEVDSTWFNAQRLRLRLRSAGTAQDWHFTVIKPVDLPEYLIASPVSPTQGHGWTNVRTSEGESSAGGVSMFTDRPGEVEDVIQRLQVRRPALGWAYKLDQTRRNLVYLDIHRLRWVTRATSSRSLLSGTANLLVFSVAPPPDPRRQCARVSPHLSFVNGASTTVVDVSAGFCRSRLLNSTDGVCATDRTAAGLSLEPLSLSEQSDAYYTSSALLSHQSGGHGLEYVFVVRPNTRLFKVNDIDELEVSDVARWICRSHDDQTAFVVDPSCLRMYQEILLPPNFVWCSRGIDFDFRSNETIPVHTISILGHGGHAIVDKVLCRGRILARKEMRTNQRIPVSVATREVKALERIQEHHHIIKIIGSYTQHYTMGLLMHSAAECDLRAAL